MIIRHFLTRFALCSLYLSLQMCAQSSPARGGGLLDADVPTPQMTGVLGRQDASALLEIANHLNLVGRTPWTGMQGTGRISYGSSTQTTYQATLTTLAGIGSRLDSQTAQGSTSIRLYRTGGKVQDEKGRMTLVFPGTAASQIVQFDILRVSQFSTNTASLADRGAVLVGGVSLHRITLEQAAALTHRQGEKTRSIDFYFDSTSHLLAKSASLIEAIGAGSKLLRVTTYDDYRQVNGSMIPFRFTQTLDGQPLWTLQLSDVVLSPTLSPNFFTF